MRSGCYHWMVTVDTAPLRDAVAAAGGPLAQIATEDREAWLDRVWDIDELPEDIPLPSGCVPYLPCPVTTVVDAMHAAAVTADDVFVDVGSGLGRTVALVHLLTGAGCIGLELQPKLVHAARARAAWLALDRLRFIEGDAVDLVRFMTVGDVFFFYCPFGGLRLQRVLTQLQAIARTRQIRVCCVGMPPLELGWLTPLPSPSVDLNVYRSSPPSGLATDDDQP